MRKNLFKKMTAAVLSMTMAVGMTGIVSAATHAANGANVAANGTWASFSVCTREDDGEWEDALKGVEVTDDDGNFLRYQTYKQDYATEGYIAAGVTSSNMQFYVVNSGWDGEYNPITGELVTDNPWGLTATMTGIPVEHGRNYTISFKIKSTLKANKTDDKGNVTGTITTKHILFKAYDPVSPGEPSVSFLTASGATTGGYITVDSSDPNYKTVTATVQIPEAKVFPSNTMGIKFALGAFLKSYPDEIAMTGSVYISDFKVTAGTQYTVSLTNGTTTQTQYVNAGSKATSVVLAKKGYTLTGYKNKATGATYNFNSAVNSNLTLVAQYTKTKAPAKPKIKSVKSPKKKRIKVTLKAKVKNAVGYQVQYSTKKTMKKSKTTTTTKKTCTIKKLKSGSLVYVRVRAYTLDSAGNKVYGKYSAKKKTVVK